MYGIITANTVYLFLVYYYYLLLHSQLCTFTYTYNIHIYTHMHISVQWINSHFSYYLTVLFFRPIYNSNPTIIYIDSQTRIHTRIYIYIRRHIHTFIRNNNMINTILLISSLLSLFFLFFSFLCFFKDLFVLLIFMLDVECLGVDLNSTHRPLNESTLFSSFSCCSSIQ